MRTALLVAVVLAVITTIAGCPSSEEQTAELAANAMDVKALEEGAVIWTGYDSSGYDLWKVELRAAVLPPGGNLSKDERDRTAVTVRACFSQVSGETDWDDTTSDDKRYDFSSFTSLGIRIYSHVDIPNTFEWKTSPLTAGPPSGQTRYFTLMDSAIAAEEYPVLPAPKTTAPPANKAEKE